MCVSSRFPKSLYQFSLLLAISVFYASLASTGYYENPHQIVRLRPQSQSITKYCGSLPSVSLLFPTPSILKISACTEPEGMRFSCVSGTEAGARSFSWIDVFKSAI